MRRMCLGFALSITLFASAAYALPMGIPIEDPSPSAQNCVNASALPSADQPLFIAVVSGFFHDARCAIGAFRVIVFRYAAATPASSNRFTLDVMIDGYPKTISGVNVYEIIGRVAEELVERSKHTTSTPPPVALRAEGMVGYLRINAQPWATIWIDGKDTGLTTPVHKHRVAPGRHTITLKNPRYRCEGSYDVDVKSGAVEVLVKRLECTQ